MKYIHSFDNATQFNNYLLSEDYEEPFVGLIEGGYAHGVYYDDSEVIEM